MTFLGSSQTYRGFSYRNLLYMRQFAYVYTAPEFTQQPVAQLPWAHKVKDE
ncbi:DUF1016 N-terminal domain-containing protein [Sabulibacter ruber]|uniref:DUF1016 N-terminal domain-containing protein n=1 Tax=Sabulibacter ruber TaxID=2811901 RepID=UPI003BFA375F